MDNKKIEKIIYAVYDSLERNNFKTLDDPDDPMYERPIIGVAAGDDPYYDFLKEHIGTFHWSPAEVLKLKYPGSVRKEKLRVVSMAFPQTEKTIKAQTGENKCPAREWNVSRGEWEPMMNEFSGRLVKRLEDIGNRCVSIDLQPEFRTMNSENLGISSRWSHRHSAYLAGLGTFGLSEGLITQHRKAIRLTSLIVEADLEKTEMPYSKYNEWCLFYKDGSCGICMNRCPIGAITGEGHDKAACEAYEEYFAAHYWPADLQRGDYILGCGLCQTGIPCQKKRP